MNFERLQSVFARVLEVWNSPVSDSDAVLQVERAKI